MRSIGIVTHPLNGMNALEVIPSPRPTRRSPCHRLGDLGVGIDHHRHPHFAGEEQRAKFLQLRVDILQLIHRFLLQINRGVQRSGGRRRAVNGSTVNRQPSRMPTPAGTNQWKRHITVSPGKKEAKDATPEEIYVFFALHGE